MSPTRRKLITGGLAAAAGVSGLAVAARLARRYGLLPPDHGGLYGPGEILTYAAQRLLAPNSLAREFPRSHISKNPFSDGPPLKQDDYRLLQTGGFADWKLTIDGMVAHPATLSLAELRSCPSHSQITQLACEEGWSFIAEWVGVPLSYLLKQAGALPQARYVVYSSLEKNAWDSIDMSEALHPQTFLTYGMNGGDLPPGHGGPLRLRVPRQCGYKSLKYVTRVTVTDHVKEVPLEGHNYAWYAGI